MPHSRRAADLSRAMDMGLDAYTDELQAKRAILDELLANWNDGRRKTLYCAAAYLLELENLQSVRAALASLPGLNEQPIKERAQAAAERLQQAADRQGVRLKLNKKLKKG